MPCALGFLFLGPTKIPTWARAPLAMAESAGAQHPCPHLTISQGQPLVIPPLSPPSGGPAMGTIGTSRPHSLSAYLGAWRKLPGVSQWVARTIRQGYTIQFVRLIPARGNRRPFNKRCDRAGTPSRDGTRVLQPILPGPKKSGGLRPILDLKRLNRHLAKYRF
ncbi:hypothetical protein DNTS_007685 [Danionella cerebrum]|uniref:Uncharacterized protein n=1 Tax=Danionella cerebrum TaxID=2873325 RepID=A0A553QQW9_9TELE|nr:hypothetical protein DNTS_007685 [Danionella translucida]